MCIRYSAPNGHWPLTLTCVQLLLSLGQWFFCWWLHHPIWGKSHQCRHPNFDPNDGDFYIDHQEKLIPTLTFQNFIFRMIFAPRMALFSIMIPRKKIIPLIDPITTQVSDFDLSGIECVYVIWPLMAIVWPLILTCVQLILSLCQWFFCWCLQHQVWWKSHQCHHPNYDPNDGDIHIDLKRKLSPSSQHQVSEFDLSDDHDLWPQNGIKFQNQVSKFTIGLVIIVHVLIFIKCWMVNIGSLDLPFLRGV